MSVTSAKELVDRFDALVEKSDELRKARLLKAVEVVHRTVEILGLAGVCFSFNGGKDSTVVLHLIRVLLAKMVLANAQEEKSKENGNSHVVTCPPLTFPSTNVMSESALADAVQEQMQQVPVMYFDSHDQFPEVRDFIESCRTNYCLTFHAYKCSFVEGVQDMINRLNIKGVYMGVRGGDPRTEEMEHFSPSTPGWPPFFRVNPILEWTYDDVWVFLRECQLDYCHLYDHGYTSLGNIYDTVPNPELWVTGKDGEQGAYLPAYRLQDGTKERNGRQRKARTTSKSE